MTDTEIWNETRGFRQSWLRLKPFILVSRLQLVGLIVASILEGFAEVGILIIVVRLALAIAADINTIDVQVGAYSASPELAVVFGLGCLLVLVRLLLGSYSVALGARISASVMVSLRDDAFEAYLNTNWSMQAEAQEGHFQELAITQVARVAMAVLAFVATISSLLNFTSMVLAAVVVNALGSLAIIVSAALLFALLMPVTRASRRYSAEMSAVNLSLANGVSESVRMVQEIDIFDVREPWAARFRALNRSTVGSWYRNQLANRLLPVAYQTTFLFFLFVGLGALSIRGGSGFESLSAVVLVLVRALSHSQSVQQNFQQLNDLVPFAERLQNTLDRWRRDVPKWGESEVELLGPIEFNNVSFGYGDTPVLKGVSMRIEPGEIIGIIGPSGSGKSTLIQLLLGLREPDSGEILASGLQRSELSRSAWGRLVAYLPQDPKLFAGSVRENIEFLRDVAEPDVIAAARQAHMDHEVASWPERYERVIGERDRAISGGQRQRVCLARALCGHPQLLVLDEPTSALDGESESMINGALFSLKGSMSVVIVSHRMSTLAICDRVMVLEHGEVQAFDIPSRIRENPFFTRALMHAQAAPGALGDR